LLLKDSKATHKVQKSTKSNLELDKSDDDPTAKTKEFNLNTYKFHALGDVVETIRRYGTTESYSTEPVSYLLFAANYLFLLKFWVTVQSINRVS
jgi:hypothetical protein